MDDNLPRNISSIPLKELQALLTANWHHSANRTCISTEMRRREANGITDADLDDESKADENDNEGESARWKRGNALSSDGDSSGDTLSANRSAQRRDDVGERVIAMFFGSEQSKRKERAAVVGVAGASFFLLGMNQHAEWAIWVGIVGAMIGVQIFFRASVPSLISLPALQSSEPNTPPDSTMELDQLVERINTLDRSQPGFQGAHVEKAAPNVIVITFADNATAEQYVFDKQLAGGKGLIVEPSNGPRVLWRR